MYSNETVFVEDNPTGKFGLKLNHFAFSIMAIRVLFHFLTTYTIFWILLFTQAVFGSQLTGRKMHNSKKYRIDEVLKMALKSDSTLFFENTTIYGSSEKTDDKSKAREKGTRLTATFKGSTVKCPINFRNVVFENIGDFDSITFIGQLLFHWCKIPDGLYFENCKFKNGFYLVNSQTGRLVFRKSFIGLETKLKGRNVGYPGFCEFGNNNPAAERLFTNCRFDAGFKYIGQ